MKNLRLNQVLLAVLISTHALASPATEDLGTETIFDPKVIYGEDNRLDYYQVEDPVLRMLADSTTVMVQLNGVTDTGSGYRFTSSETLADNNVCSEEPFSSQPTPGFCSAFLVSPDLVVTAGHCASSLNVTNIAFVFGFQMEDENTPVTEFPYENVYFGAELVARQGSTCTNDWSMIRLDRSVEGRPPLAVRREGKIPDLQSLVVIGYPVGLPVKISGGANVRSNTGFRTFVANLDTYQGNSGSAVFNADTLEVEGVLVCGETDFIFDSGQGCKVSNRCPDEGCRGEDCTRATEWDDLIPTDPCAGDGELAFITPKTGDSFPRGQQAEVSWSSFGAVGDKVDLLLFFGDYFSGNSWRSLVNTCGSTNRVTIDIPADLPVDSHYRFRIHNSGTGENFIGAFSPYFSIAKGVGEESPEIKVTAPVQAETGIVGGLKEVLWTSTADVGNEVRLLLFRGQPESLVWQFVDLHLPNHPGENSYLWTLPLGLSAGNDYRVRILSTSTDAADLSEPFSVIEPDEIQVTSPDPWTRGVVGQELEVRWNSKPGVEGPVEMLVFAGQAPVWQGVRISGIPNQSGENSFRWRIPESWSSSLYPGTPLYSIKIFQDEVRGDFSDLFSINRVPTSIVIDHPSRGEVWSLGEDVPVEWTSTGEVRTQLQLLLFREIDGKLFWQFVAEPLANQSGSNSSNWTVPTGLVEADDYLIKIYDPADGSLFDLSETFSISVPSSKNGWGPDELIHYLESRKGHGAAGDLRLPLFWNPVNTSASPTEP